MKNKFLEIEQKLHQNLESDSRSGFGTNQDVGSLKLEKKDRGDQGFSAKPKTRQHGFKVEMQGATYHYFCNHQIHSVSNHKKRSLRDLYFHLRLQQVFKVTIPQHTGGGEVPLELKTRSKVQRKANE